MGAFDSVGSLLADIANIILEGLQVFNLEDKRHWGPDEHEHSSALDEALNQAKRDFQEFTPLVNGQAQYEHDRNTETMRELRLVRDNFRSHIQLLKDWSRSGGPINPAWVREFISLERELHRAQCRAARRIFTSSQESSQRCLGAFLVHRAQTKLALVPGQNLTERDYKRRQLQELAACTKIGGFNPFGQDDVAFICDFCDGHLIWEDLEKVPTERTTPRTPPSIATHKHWQATGLTASGPQEKQVIFAPVAIANHVAPLLGDWQARLLCPFCEELARQPQDEDDDEEGWRPDDEFEDVAALQEHLEWQHADSLSSTGTGSAAPSTSSCLLM